MFWKTRLGRAVRRGLVLSLRTGLPPLFPSPFSNQLNICLKILKSVYLILAWEWNDDSNGFYWSGLFVLATVSFSLSCRHRRRASLTLDS